LKDFPDSVEFNNETLIIKRIAIPKIKDIQRIPFEGIGKHEPLKFDLAGR
jgi:Txe/YoeB family toxin of Txe-Axe toxin-antitoxin module